MRDASVIQGCPSLNVNRYLVVILTHLHQLLIHSWLIKEGIQNDKFQCYCLEPPIFNSFGQHQEAFSYLLTLDLPSSCTDPSDGRLSDCFPSFRR